VLDCAHELGRQRLARLAFERGEVQPLLAAEVARDQGGIDAGARADVTDRRGVVATLVEQRVGGVEQRTATGLGVIAPTWH